jgi:hypothetical protein
MSNLHLPAEILDHIVDHLCDTEDALRSCCLVSKSWIPRTRKYLFADIRFHLVRDVLSWKKTFPDPSTSPAHHARILFIDGFAVIAAAEAEADGCIGSFSRVMGSEAGADRTEPDFDQSAGPLAPFHGFSPIIKSLWVVVPTLPLSQVFNLIFSFPILEDLDVTLVEQYSNDGNGSNEDKMPTAVQPPSPPMFTGSLELCLSEEMEPFTRRLLSLPGGIHFRNLTLTWLHEEDHLLTTALVEGCSHTLESLDIDWNLVGASTRHLWSTLIAYSCFQASRGQVLLTLRKRQNSEKWCFGPIRGPSNGSLRHSKLSRPNTGIFDKSRFGCAIRSSTSSVVLVSTPTSGKRLEKRVAGSG